MKTDMIIFDLDGTLLDSIGGIANASNHVLEDNGYPIRKVEEYVAFIGAGVRGTISNALPDSVIDEPVIARLVEEFKAYYQKNCLVGTYLYEGVGEMLDVLAEREVPVAINTNKHASISYRIIEALFDRWQLVGYLAPDGTIPLKPDPQGAKQLLAKTGADPARSIYVGDSEIDVQTARQAGMKSIIVSWGYGSRQLPFDDEPDVIIDHPRDILNHI